MNKQLYFRGNQIKSYLIAFASVFSEIYYNNRYNELKEVPIVYGSPSDIISYMESNVDNLTTKNRNRIKDLRIPIFSFRLTNLERDVEKRRTPYTKLTIDLRQLGYGTGYTTLYPSPFKFNFELTLWADSDLQCFEILEQIVPYFNASQDIIVEILPKTPARTCNLNLDSIEVNTDPQSQKYSATAVLMFSLKGWLFSQPKIWSTNMQFELEMLDKEVINSSINDNNNEEYIPNDIIDLN